MAGISTPPLIFQASSLGIDSPFYDSGVDLELSPSAHLPWHDIAEKKRVEREIKLNQALDLSQTCAPDDNVLCVYDFPAQSGILTQRELDLTSVTATVVVANIAAGRWTAEEVLRATIKRAVIAQQLVNCLSELCFDSGIRQARELDAYFARTGKTVGPLHGLPISLKDQFNLTGLDSTLGYVSKAGCPAVSESTLVKILHKAGAVSYCKTNVPVTLMLGETYNNIFGRTVNPFNRSLTPGGSSGGEGALIALGGSFLGVGTDIGGSIRIPCSYCGLWGLRPSHGRVPYRHVVTSFVGQEAVRSTAGPMCRSVEDVELFMKTVAASEPWLQDPQIVPIPWRDEAAVLPRQLCFGIAFSDGKSRSSPPITRALNMVKTALEAAGHKVIEYIPHECGETLFMIQRLFSADGGEEFQRDSDASGEPLPAPLERWLGRSANAPRSTVFETWQIQQSRLELQERWSTRWEASASLTGTGRPIDGLIMPPVLFPAHEHDFSYPSSPFGTLSPVLDLTTGSIPVTSVDLLQDVKPAGWQPVSEEDDAVMAAYDRPEKFENAPIGVTLVGRRLEEEKVVAMMRVVGAALDA